MTARTVAAPLALLILLSQPFQSLGAGTGAGASQVGEMPLSLQEIVRQADVILVGTVTGRTSRWGNASRRFMVTDHVLVVEDLVYQSPGARPIGATVILPYWGGTIGDETHALSDLRRPEVGERLLVMLRPDWDRTLGVPVVGFNQGLFSIGTSADGSAVVRSSAGTPVTLGTSAETSLATFTAWVRANVETIKARPLEPASRIDPNAPDAMRVFAKTPEAPGAILPAFTPLPERAGLPIVVNGFPASFGSWYPQDQLQMGKWNYYASVFQPSSSPTGTFRWGDRVFDLAGWPSSEVLNLQYGTTWEALGSGTLGVTFLSRGGGVIREADIALNPNVPWTLNDEAVYDGESVYSFRHVMLHELGHMMGLDHSFETLALMNYLPGPYRGSLPHADDAGGIRYLYPSQAISRTDLAVYLFRNAGYQNAVGASFPTTASAGGTLTVSGYTVENVGTTTISNPVIEWYLTTARHYSLPYYYLGISQHGSLAPLASFDPLTLSTTLPIPADVPRGYYYLAAHIRNDGGPEQSSFPFSNNNAFGRRKIFINTPPGAFSRNSPEHGATGQFASVVLDWGQSAGATLYEYCLDTINNGGCDAPWIPTGTNTFVEVSGLAGGTTYYWHVRAWNNDGLTYANGSASTFWPFTTAGTIAVNTPLLNFSAVNTGGALSPVTPAQSVVVTTSQPGIEWFLYANQPWVELGREAGTGSGSFTVGIRNPGNILNGVTTTTAQITLLSPDASNSPLTVTVHLTMKNAADLQAPYGIFDTPTDNATVQGSLAVTGWALDDVGIDRVEIWRDRIPNDPAPPFLQVGHPGHGKVFIANGTFVAGTRPDVAAAYPGAPFHNRGGWGYLLLTWGFPNSNGTFLLTAVAWDKEGRHTVLGAKTVHVTNATATKPFGTIDVPSYGGTFSGHHYTFGWALTPSPGCTMAGGQLYMTIDSFPQMFPVTYGANRTDIAAAFPQFADSQGAGGAVALDSTKYTDGIHTIGWLVYDSCGNGDGIGSRFFTILNGGAPAAAVEAQGPAFSRVGGSLSADLIAESASPLWLSRGVGRPALPLRRDATVWLSQTGRLELHALPPEGAAPEDNTFDAYLAVNGRFEALPAGSSFDTARGTFHWQPVAGFLGEFPIHIRRLRAGAVEEQWTTRIVIGPEVDGVHLTVEVTDSSISGTALDPLSIDGAGIGAVHVWARRAGSTSVPSGDFFFLGQAALGLSQPDVAAARGPQFHHAGYTLTVPSLPAGQYEVVVYAWSERTARWDAARVTTLTVGRGR